MSNILLDTNIFIYAINADSKYNEKYIKVLISELDLFTTTKNVSEYFAVLTKFNLNVTVLYPTAESTKIFEELLKKYKPVGNRVFDFEVVSIMLINNINELATIKKKILKL